MPADTQSATQRMMALAMEIEEEHELERRAASVRVGAYDVHGLGDECTLVGAPADHACADHAAAAMLSCLRFGVDVP